MNNILSVENLCLWYGSHQALKDINIEIPEKSITALIGPSGCGKSTFLKTLDRMNDLIPDVKITGSVLYKGEDIFDSSVDVSELRRQVGMVFQNFNLFPHYTVLQNVTDALICVQKMPKDEALARGRELLARMGLADKEAMVPCDLSGGQQQRVGVARALVVEPDIIFADEPTGNLDSASSREIMEILKSMHRSGETLILITHDNGIAAQAKRVVRIMDGKIESDMINEEFVEEA